MINFRILKSKSFTKFVFFGALITFLSNGVLLFMIFILPLSTSTFISQVFHAYLGYIANKYGVFKRKGKPLSYIFLVLVSWFMQWFLIKNMFILGISYKWSVLFSIPFLATFSYINQKYFVFGK